MTSGLRWRIISLQTILVLVLAFVTGFLFWASSFVTAQIHDQLVPQAIKFPAASVLADKEYNNVSEIRQYAGQTVDNGEKARVYANDFIGVHIAAMKPYNTYAAASSALQTMDKKSAEYTTVSAQRNTLFMGTMLRTSLLNAYAWGQVAFYAFWAAIGLLIATIAVAGALAFELLQLRKPAIDKVVVRQPATAAV